MTSPDSDQSFTEEEALALRRAADELVESQARIVWLEAESERLYKHREACQLKRDEILEPLRKAEQQRIQKLWDRKLAVRKACMTLALCVAIAYGCLFTWRFISKARLLHTPAITVGLLGCTACWCYIPWIRHMRNERSGAKA